jgi:hypothetical protein
VILARPRIQRQNAHFVRPEICSGCPLMDVICVGICDSVAVQTGSAAAAYFGSFNTRCRSTSTDVAAEASPFRSNEIISG